MDGSPKREQLKGSLSVLPVFICLLLATYILSYGPACGLASRGYLGRNPYPKMRMLYAPLLFVQDRNATVEAALTWYACWFVPTVTMAAPRTIAELSP